MQGKDGLIAPGKKKMIRWILKKVSVQGKAISTGMETLQSFLEKLSEIGGRDH